MLLECQVGLGEVLQSAKQVKRGTFHHELKNIQQIKQQEQRSKLISSEVQSVKDREAIPESVSMKCAVPKRRTGYNWVWKYL